MCSSACLHLCIIQLTREGKVYSFSCITLEAIIVKTCLEGYNQIINMMEHMD